MNVSKSVGQYLNGSGNNKGRKSDERYASFDFCYNYFYQFYKSKNLADLASGHNLQISCLQVGFYLASWGMMRGSSFLLSKNVRKYRDLINSISNMSPVLWEIDVDKYSDENINLLLDCKNQIVESLGRENRPSDTLVTKIMLGVFSNVPAFDQFFTKSMKRNGFKVHSLNLRSLREIKRFYDAYEAEIDSFEVFTLDFLTGKETNVVYTKAKLVDMCGFIDGH